MADAAFRLPAYVEVSCTHRGERNPGCRKTDSDNRKCTNPPRGVRSPLTWARRSVTTTGKSYTDADLITAVANLAFDGLFHYRCSL